MTPQKIAQRNRLDHILPQGYLEGFTSPSNSKEGRLWVFNIERGTLVTVLDDWCAWIPGLFLYYPGHRQVPPGLRAFIDVLKEAP